MNRSYLIKRKSEGGQGLVEYALLLVLIAAVVVGGVTIMGPDVGNVFSVVSNGLGTTDGEGSDVEPEEEVIPDVVVIDRATYDPASETLHLHATSDGGSDPSVTLTASPGGVMTPYADLYHLYVYGLTGCPCEVTITSSAGGSASVVVGP
jgi:pilus assembly protein Flp/PilA